MESEINEIVTTELFKTSDTLPPSPYVPVTRIGGKGGKPVSFYGGYDGSLMNKIGVWVGESQIKSIKVWRTNGLSHHFGVASGPYQEFTFEPGEIITNMSLWGNGEGTRLGAIKFNTTKGIEFFAKMTKWDLKQEYPIDIGSGICVGVLGNVANDIDSLGFMFIKPLESSTMIDVKYPQLGLQQAKVQINSLKSIHYENILSTPQEYTLEISETIIKKENWSVTAGLEFSFQTTVKAGIPEVFETTTGYGLKASVSSTYGMENSTESTEIMNFPIKIPAKSRIKATVSMGRADIDLRYTARIEMRTTDGSELSFIVEGNYHGVTYTDVRFVLDEF